VRGTDVLLQGLLRLNRRPVPDRRGKVPCRQALPTLGNDLHPLIRKGSVLRNGPRRLAPHTDQSTHGVRKCLLCASKNARQVSIRRRYLATIDRYSPQERRGPWDNGNPCCDWIIQP